MYVTSIHRYKHLSLIASYPGKQTNLDLRKKRMHASNTAAHSQQLLSPVGQLITGK